MVWKFRSVTIVLPALKDPRVFMISVLIVYTIVGQTWLSFDHSWGQILTSLFVACLLDVGVSYWKSRQIVFPASGIITGLGLGLLIEAIPLWPFIVAPVLAILSKSLIRFQGKHLFNPSNFGLTVLLLLFPSVIASLAAQWSGSLLIVMIILVVGGFSSFRVSRWDLVITFLLGFAVMSMLEYLFTDRGLAFVYGPMFGTAFQLFTLSMITDPKTTPDTRSKRIAFGLSLAVIDGIFRLWNYQYSLFVALLIVSACVPVLHVLVPVVRSYGVSWWLDKKKAGEMKEAI